jgi:hypothetical protein
MTAEERREAARRRVRAWKEANPYSTKLQRKRRYARRKKAVEAEVRKAVEVKVPEKRAPREVQKRTW